jgi:hypothetical protein
MKKTIFVALMCIVTLLTVGIGTASATTAVYVDPATVTSGDCETVSIMIQTDEAAGIGSATMQLTYNPARVTYDSKVADGPIGEVTVYEPVAGTLNMVAATAAEPGPDGTFTFVELEFCPVGDPGDCSDLVITVEELTDGNVDDIIPDDVADGEFCISAGEGRMRGDLNGDYMLTSIDAAIALEIAVGSRPFDDAADVNHDGKVTSIDALMILQAAVGGIGF